MKQVLIIHGGDSFTSYDLYIANLKETELTYDRLRKRLSWKDSLVEAFPSADILLPTMPNSANAKFNEWSIWFEKIIPFLKDDVSIIGHSLGAMFLAKYLHEKPLTKPVSQLILLAGGYNEDNQEYGQFRIQSATGLEKSARSIHIMHSEDDFIVPYEALAKYEQDLPTATTHHFKNKNHFLDDSFPELIEILKQK